MIVAGSHPHPLATAEIYTPGTNSWAPAATMSQARGGAAVAALSTGKVLVAGGVFGTAAFPATEIYDPVGNTWSAGPPMPTPRGGAGIVNLAAGRVLVTGGSNTSGEQSVSEIYDAGANTWSSTGSMENSREFFQITRLANGNVLASGGEAPGPLSGAEVYTPPCFSGCAVGGQALVPDRRATPTSNRHYARWDWRSAGAAAIGVFLVVGLAFARPWIKRRSKA